MRTRLSKRLLLIAGVLVITGCAHQTLTPVSRKATVDPKAQRLRSIVASEIAAKLGDGLPGVSVALVHRDKVLWTEGFGWADRGARIPADAGTVYRVGSLAKPFTALAVMQLAERGVLDIDQPLSLYLPEFRIRSRYDLSAAPVTVRSVLSHRAGLPSDLNRGMWSDTSFTRVAFALRAEYLAFPPERVFSYSNLGYSLLGHAVESVSERPFAEHMREALFRPLGMVDTGFVPQGPMAAGYREGDERSLLPIRDLPAFGLHTTAEDLGRFMGALLGGGGPVRETTFSGMTEVQNPERPLDGAVRVGLGWFLEQGSIVRGADVVRHGGTTLYFSSDLVLLPELRLGVAVLANSGEARHEVSQLAERLLRLAAGELLGPALEMARDEPVSTAVSAVGDRLPWSGGRFATDLGLLAVRPEEGELCACINGESVDVTLLPDGRLGMATDALPAPFAPLRGWRLEKEVVDGEELLVGYRDGRRRVFGAAVPRQPIPSAWRQRAGRWEVENADRRFPVTDLRLIYENDALCLSYRMPVLSERPVRVPLVPVSDTLAVIGGLGRSRGDSVRFDPVSRRLYWSGYIASPG